VFSCACRAPGGSGSGGSTRPRGRPPCRAGCGPSCGFAGYTPWKTSSHTPHTGNMHKQVLLLDKSVLNEQVFELANPEWRISGWSFLLSVFLDSITYL